MPTKYEIIYDRLCNGCSKAKYCHEECITCDEFDNQLETEPNRTLQDLTIKDIKHIKEMVESDFFTKKEICEEYGISNHTLWRVIKYDD